MIFHLLKHPNTHRFLSAAFDQRVKADLQSSNTEYFSIRNSRLIISSTQEEVELKPSDLNQLIEKANNYDVFELFENGILVRRIDVTSEDNILFITGRCNSNCIMCPSPEYSRRNDPWPDIDRQIDLSSHIPATLPHITITGGEPFLAGKRIFDLFDFLKAKFTETEFLLLTNGRIFCMNSYADLYKETAPPGILTGIPIHASNAHLHDLITQSKGSFDQTITGIHHLLQRSMRVEIRVVVSALNIHDLKNIGKMIIEQFNYPTMSHVCIIAMEMTGAARVNKDQIWIPYKETSKEVQELTDLLIAHQIDVQLYNFPLCTIHPSHWMLSRKSISVNKVRYAKTCLNCKVKSQCGGLFAGTLSLEEKELEAFL